MAFSLPRFYPILDLSIRSERSLEDTVRPLLDAGVRLLQLRAKDVTSKEFLETAEKLLALVPPTMQIVINDRADVALLSGAAGVHVGQDDLPPAHARRLLGEGKLVGISTHAPEQVRAAEKEPVDYIAFGPIFSTTTKQDIHPVVGLEGLRAARKLTSKLLVAIGGITPENAAQIIDSGADSVAVISAWQTAPGIPARLEAFRRALGRLDK